MGAGIAGLSCALNLVREGKSVVVLENRVRGAGQVRLFFLEISSYYVVLVRNPEHALAFFLSWRTSAGFASCWQSHYSIRSRTSFHSFLSLAFIVLVRPFKCPHTDLAR